MDMLRERVPMWEGAVGISWRREMYECGPPSPTRRLQPSLPEYQHTHLVPEKRPLRQWENPLSALSAFGLTDLHRMME